MPNFIKSQTKMLQGDITKFKSNSRLSINSFIPAMAAGLVSVGSASKSLLEKLCSLLFDTLIKGVKQYGDGLIQHKEK